MSELLTVATHEYKGTLCTVYWHPKDKLLMSMYDSYEGKSHCDYAANEIDEPAPHLVNQMLRKFEEHEDQCPCQSKTQCKWNQETRDSESKEEMKHE